MKKFKLIRHSRFEVYPMFIIKKGTLNNLLRRPEENIFMSFLWIYQNIVRKTLGALQI